MRALGAKDFVAARKLALQILEENERWKQDVREHGFAQHPWVWKDDNDKFHALNPDVLVDLILRAAEEQ